MVTCGNVVLITGGGSGIGLAIAKKFQQAGNRVIITGRNKEKLISVKEHFQEIDIEVADIAREADISRLAENHSDVNILVNNAGVQYNYNLLEEPDAYRLIREEFDINLIAPALLIQRFLPILLRKNESAIINVTSGLAFVPKESAPVYCAGKAGLHIFSKSLRYQLESSSIKLFEIIPSLVDTSMTEGRGKGKISPDQLTDEFWKNFKKDNFEILVGKVKLLYWLNRILPKVAERIMRKGL
jgi:short-subunit dehydrogenase involved in D-alanine esterification of teichoic acids